MDDNKKNYSDAEFIRDMLIVIGFLCTAGALGVLVHTIKDSIMNPSDVIKDLIVFVLMLPLSIYFIKVKGIPVLREYLKSKESKQHKKRDETE